MNWKDAKTFVLARLEKANVSGEAAKAILAFERKITTCRNLLSRGASWETMTYSEPFHKARDLMDDLNAGAEWGMEDAKHWGEWCKYAEACGSVPNSNLGDMLC